MIALRWATVAVLLASATTAVVTGRSEAQAPSEADRPWLDPNRSADDRAALLLRAMTRDEKLSMVRTHFPNRMANRPADVIRSAGFHPGIPRLGIPEQRLTDATLGIAANQRPPDDVTALPSGLMLAASWDPAKARQAGALVAREARAMGFNILLGGGVNLVRDPRGGRAFEYLGEDALLAGTLGGQAIAGTQAEKVLSTVKHYVINPQETGRAVVDSRISLAALRESDLLAFQKAIEVGAPGSVMCSYNKINGPWACEDPVTLGVLKRDWRYPGYVMSDWGAVHSTVAAANAGLDQESGWEIAPKAYFGRELADAVTDGRVPPARLDDMVRRVLRSMFAAGLFEARGRSPLDRARGNAVALDIARNGITLLKNDAAALPLSRTIGSVLVVGRQADFGVLSGGGSAQVLPIGSRRIDPPAGAPAWGRGTIYHPSSPLAEIRAIAPKARVTWVSGTDVAAAERAAASVDAVVVLAHLWGSEAMDADIVLPDAQDRLIAALATANPRTIVVLESNAAVAMPWIDRVPGVLAAWYSGAAGGRAIAEVLFGTHNADGRLPITFPRSASQLPLPVLPGSDRPVAERDLPETDQPSFEARYVEGADVGYRWFSRRGERPLFPFGWGLSYTRFRHGMLTATPKGARFQVTNVGSVAGTDTPQVYVTPPGGTPRLAGWARLKLSPGEARTASVTFDPRTFATFDDRAGGWRVAPGRYRVTLARHADDPGMSATVQMAESRYTADWRGPDGQVAQ